LPWWFQNLLTQTSPMFVWQVHQTHPPRSGCGCQLSHTLRLDAASETVTWQESRSKIRLSWYVWCNKCWKIQVFEGLAAQNQNCTNMLVARLALLITWWKGAPYKIGTEIRSKGPVDFASVVGCRGITGN
jgi:hypothetical protein